MICNYQKYIKISKSELEKDTYGLSSDGNPFIVKMFNKS